MFLETGTIVFLSLIVLFWRFSTRARLWFLGHPVWLEVPIGIAAYALHYGTFNGMMAAATAVCITFVFVQLARWLIGYTYASKYVPGVIDLKVQP